MVGHAIALFVLVACVSPLGEVQVNAAVWRPAIAKRETVIREPPPSENIVIFDAPVQIEQLRAGYHLGNFRRGYLIHAQEGLAVDSSRRQRVGILSAVERWNYKSGVLLCWAAKSERAPMDHIVSGGFPAVHDHHATSDQSLPRFNPALPLWTALVEKPSLVSEDIGPQGVSGMPSAIQHKETSADTQHNSEQGDDHRRKSYRVVDRPLPKGFAYFIFGILVFGSIGGALLVFLDSRRRLF